MQAAEKARHEEKRAVVVNSRVAEVAGDRVSAILRVNAFEIICYLVESLIPADASPTVRNAANGIFQPVFVVVKVSQRSSLRTDVALTEWIVFVAADIERVASFEFRVSSFELEGTHFKTECLRGSE